MLFVFGFCLCHVCSLQLCGHLLGRGQPLGSFLCDVFLCFVTVPYNVLGQVRYLIVSFSDLCLLSYFEGKRGGTQETHIKDECHNYHFQTLIQLM